MRFELEKTTLIIRRAKMLILNIIINYRKVINDAIK
jgi:hypothetical protein